MGGSGTASDVNSHGAIDVESGTAGSTGRLCAGSPLTSAGKISTGSGSAELAGTITSQGTLTINADTTVPGTQKCGVANHLANDGGTVTIGNSRTLDVHDAYIQGSGTTDLGTDGRMTVEGALLVSGGSFAGTRTPIVDGGELDPIAGSGTFTMHGTSAIGEDVVAAGITIDIEGTSTADANVATTAGPTENNGTINLTSTDGSHGARLRASTGTITNKGTIATLLGAGGVRQLGNSFDNQGTMLIGADTSSESSHPLQLTTSGSDFEVQGGATLSLSGFSQTGGGVGIYGTLDDSGVPTVSGGRLEGTGAIKAALFTNSGGTVDPGDGVGVLTVNGNYTQGSGGALAIRVEGTTPGTGFDVLAVSGTATLGGTLNVTTIGAPKGAFRIVQANQVNGNFSGFAFTGQSYSVVQSQTGVTLVTPPSNSAKPSVVGRPRVGSTLTCTTGIWVPQGSPFTYTYRWLRDGAPLASTSAKRKVIAADHGHALSCRVTATSNGLSDSATSSAVKVPLEPVDRGTFPKKTLRATKAGDVVVPVRNPNPVAVAGTLTLRNAKGKVVGSAKFTIAKASKKPVKVHLKSGAFAKLLAAGQRKYRAVLVLSKGAVKRTSKATLTVKKPKP